MQSNDLNEKLIEVIFSVSRMMKESGAIGTETSNLTLQQLQALIFIGKNEKVTMSDLATFFSITSPTATTLTNRLIKAGLITRNHDKQDRRLVRIALSQKGQTLLHEAKKIHSKKMNHFLSYLAEKEKEELLRIMQSLYTRVKEDNDK